MWVDKCEMLHVGFLNNFFCVKNVLQVIQS